jgi:hypothetical protein
MVAAESEANPSTLVPSVTSKSPRFVMSSPNSFPILTEGFLTPSLIGRPDEVISAVPTRVGEFINNCPRDALVSN